MHNDLVVRHRGELTLGAVVVRFRIWSPALDALERGATAREADLVPSLEAYLHHNGSWETAARALGVHRHTLRARMARVEELTGLTLDSADNRVLWVLALMSRPETSLTSTSSARSHPTPATAGPVFASMLGRHVQHPRGRVLVRD